MELFKTTWYEGEKGYKEVYNSTPEEAAKNVVNILKMFDNVSVKKFNVK